MHFESPLGIQAAAELPTQPPPKPPKPGGVGFPGYRKNTVANTAAIPKPRFDVANVDLTSTYRTGGSTVEVVRNLTRFSPELAASRAAHIRIGIPEKYIAIARDPDGAFNREATQLVLQLLRQMNTMPDYINGFSQVGSLRSVSEALARSLFEEGAASLELVLDKTRLPNQFVPIPESSLIFYEDGKGTKPAQKVGGDELDLDIATFFRVVLDPSLYNAYAESPLESAVQPVFASTTFLSDMRKLCARHIHKRYDISIIEEKLMDRIPPEVSSDPEQLSLYLNGILEEVNTAISDLGVDEALVHYDFFEVKYIEGDTGDTPATFDTVRNIYDGKIATASKTPPSIMGMGSTTQNVASTETLMFMMNVNGMIRLKLQELYSKALTLAVRLFGLDVTVEFEFDDIDLRPANELEAFKAMKFARITDQLSLGLIGDDEAGLRLTGQLPPAGFKPLSGTMFKMPSKGTDAEEPGKPGNPNSTTSAAGKKAPEKAKGPQK